MYKRVGKHLKRNDNENSNDHYFRFLDFFLQV
jgi:hypothetical protein